MNTASRLFRAVTQSRFPGGGKRDRDLLRDRYTLIAKAVFWLTVGFYLLGMATYARRAGGMEDWFSQPRAYWGLVTPTLALLMWVIMHRVPWSDMALNLWDGGVLLALCVVMAIRYQHLDSVLAPGNLVASFSTLLVFRAVVIPSSGWRTFIIGLICAIPPIWSVLNPIPVVAAYESISPARMAETRSMVAPWIAIGVTISTVASNVIYGLRKEVAKARKLGQYELQDKLGAGGMGEVYRASHAMLRRPTAVKLIRPELAGEEALARFENEVQATASLTHPNTVAIYDYGRTPDGVFYYAMEFLEGFDLDHLVTKFGPMPSARVIHVLTQACASLHEAHSAALIHRDIKPANIVLTRRGGIADVVKVVDFGLVKDVNPDRADATEDDKVLGTPQYLAPETIRTPNAVTSAIDIYALGAVGFFLLTGSPVFRHNSVTEMCAAHLEEQPQRPADRIRRPLPDDLQDIILRCLSKDHRDRPTARDLADAMRQCADAGSWSKNDADAWWIANSASPTAEEAAAKRDESASAEGAAEGTLIIDPTSRGAG